MAEVYREPIENFIEKASLSKPTPRPRPVIEKKPKPKKKRPLSSAQQSNVEPSVKSPRERKRLKKSRPMEENRQPGPREHPEIEEILLSMIRESQGVFEPVPRIDLLFRNHIQKFFPQTAYDVDNKAIMSTLDGLERTGDLLRVMLSSNTTTGLKQYKSLLILPDVDPSTSQKLSEIREEFYRETVSNQSVVNYGMPPPVQQPPQTQIISTEIVQPVPKSVSAAPIPKPVPPTSLQIRQSAKRKRLDDGLPTTKIPLKSFKAPTKPSSDNAIIGDEGL